jgi:uncharacterized phosphosugar-binding protein
MSEQMEQYVTLLQEKLNQLYHGNQAALERAAEVCADAVAAKKVIHIYDTGHIISHEMIMRTGGLVAYSHLSFDGSLDNRNIWREKNLRELHPTPQQALESERSLLDWLFSQRTLQAGDVLIIGSVSGLGTRLVELAEQARARGLFVIAITGVDFSSQLSSKHPSGKRLYEAVDLVLDNQSDYGDSFFTIPGVERKICPSSGLAATTLMWTLTVGIVEKLVARGLQPSIFESVNLPNGPAQVETTEASYREKGY